MGAPDPQVEASGPGCQVPVPRALPPGWGPMGLGSALSPRPRPAAAHRRLEGATHGRHRPAPGARLRGPGPESPRSRPSTRSRGARSVRSSEKGFLNALGTVTKSTLQLKRDSPRTGPERPPPSVRSRRGSPLLAPQTADRGGSRRPRLCGAFGLEGPSLCRWSLGVPALQIFPGAGVGGGDVQGGLESKPVAGPSRRSM